MLVFAARYNYLTLELLEALVSRGADVNARDKEGKTVLMWSARNGYLTPELALALCRKMRASGTPVKELWREMTMHNPSGSTDESLVSVLTEWLRTDPGEVADLLSAPEEKKRINEWRTGNLPGMDELFRNAAECMTEEAFFRVFDEETQTEKERAVLKRGLGRIFASDRTCGGADKPCAFVRGER